MITDDISDEQLQQIIKENSLLLSPLAQNNWFEKCFAFEAMRMNTAMKVHQYLFDPRTFDRLEDKDIVTVYQALLKDAQHQKISNMKIVEMKETSRIISGLSKAYAEQEKRRQISSSGQQSHVDKLVQTLLDESLRHAMNDQMNKLYGGSNTYRPPEDKSFEIVVKDPNADE